MNSRWGAIALCILLCGCDRPRTTDATREQTPWPTTAQIPRWDSSRPLSDQVSAAELEKLKRQAWGGDADSGYLVMLYFEGLPHPSSQDIDTWVQIAAENGSGAAASILAANLMNLGGEQNCLRAKFWFERAADLEGGNRSAATTIKQDLGDLAEHWAGCIERGAVRHQ